MTNAKYNGIIPSNDLESLLLLSDPKIAFTYVGNILHC